MLYYFFFFDPNKLFHDDVFFIGKKNKIGRKLIHFIWFYLRLFAFICGFEIEQIEHNMKCKITLVED